MSADRSLTLDHLTAPPVLIALRVAAQTYQTAGVHDQARRFERLLDDLTEDFNTAPTGADALRMVDVLISGFEDDHDARIYLTDLVRMLSVVAPGQTHAWASRMIEGRANR